VWHPSDWAMIQPLVFCHVAFHMSMGSGTPRLHNVVKGRRTHTGVDHDTSRSTAGGIAGTQVARELILQGGPAIQTTVSPSGYVSASE
jgi:hypothetical protein